MAVYFIPPTGNLEICIHEAMAGKESLEARLKPKWAASLFRNYNTKDKNRMPGDVTGFPGFVHRLHPVPVQAQSCFARSYLKGLLQIWSPVWELTAKLGLNPQTVIRHGMIAKALKACVQDHMGGLRAMNYELWSITRMQPWELGKYSFGDSKEEKKNKKHTRFR